MERYTINYKGVEYPIIEVRLSDISDIQSDEIVLVSDYELWSAIEEGYNNGEGECACIDNQIYYYCDSGFIASNPTDEEVIKYLKENCG